MKSALRALFAAFFLFTSLYCLIAFMPFTYQQLVKGDVLPALTRFAQLHQWLYLGVVLVSVPAFWRPFTARRIGFLSTLAAGGIALAFHPVLARLENNTTSMVWAFVFLAPVVWLALLDISESGPYLRWPAGRPDEDRAVFHAAWVTALFVAATYANIAAYRHPAEWNRSADWFALAITAVSHVLVFLLFFVLLNLAGVVAGWLPSPARMHFVLCHVFGASMLFGVFRAVVFPALSFSGSAATAYAAGFAVAATVFMAGLSVGRADRAGGDVPSGLLLAFWFTKPPQARLPRLVAGMAAAAAVAAVLATNISRMDWNFLFQKLTVLIVWIAAFRVFFAAMHSQYRPPSPTGRLLFCALMIVPGYRLHERARTFVWQQTGEKLSAAQFLDRWAGYDASFKLIHDSITPEARDSDFYRYLVRNTNIPRSVEVAPVPVDFVDRLAPAAGAKPNIFVIVIDSLRRDYLSPYNTRVDFTPQVAEFARDSVVFDNAFTHYGGTGMSEPSIWVGGMIVHKQYVTPFAPMNALQKLIVAENYNAYISRDPILQTVVSPFPRLQELDYGKPNGAYDLCSSLEELDQRLATRRPGEAVFAYTQPQNIHISVINHEGAKPISKEDYHGFYAPYASRLRRIDGCFGGFIDKLKTRGLYESSVVILTADHGDSLGEQGRWGHAYTIYPEIVRIPLIVHLPTALRDLRSRRKAIAFSTDITPTLYYLTGHQPTMRNEIFGRTLFARDEGELTERRPDDYLIASSYAAVYGVLSGDGKRLSVSDAVNYKDYAADVPAYSGGTEPLSGGARAAIEKRIKERIVELSGYYKFTSGGPAR